MRKGMERTALEEERAEMQGSVTKTSSGEAIGNNTAEAEETKGRKIAQGKAREAGNREAMCIAPKLDSEETDVTVQEAVVGETKGNKAVEGSATETSSVEADGSSKAKDSTQESSDFPHNIYDRIAKRCLSLSARCTVNLINGLFGTNYQPDSDVQYHWTENVDDGLKQTLSDTIITINGSHSYHCEFQMTSNGDMILRMLEYGFHHAVKSRKGLDVLEFPEPLVVYLNKGEVPEAYKICIRFGTQGEFEYEVPVCQYLEETREDTRKRDQMIVLVPFQLVRLKRAVEKAKQQNREMDPKDMEELKKIVTYDIVEALEKNVAVGNISKVEKDQIIGMTRMLYEHIYGGYAQKMPEVGQMLDDALVLDSDKYYYQIRIRDRELAEKKQQYAEELKKKDAQHAKQMQEKDAQHAKEMQEKDAQYAEQIEEMKAQQAEEKEAQAQRIQELERRLREAGIPAE